LGEGLDLALEEWRGVTDFGIFDGDECDGEEKMIVFASWDAVEIILVLS
jgi:hypothetical protein